MAAIRNREWGVMTISRVEGVRRRLSATGTTDAYRGSELLADASACAATSERAVCHAVHSKVPRGCGKGRFRCGHAATGDQAPFSVVAAARCVRSCGAVAKERGSRAPRGRAIVADDAPVKPQVGGDPHLSPRDECGMTLAPHRAMGLGAAGSQLAHGPPLCSEAWGSSPPAGTSRPEAGPLPGRHVRTVGGRWLRPAGPERLSRTRARTMRSRAVR